MSDVNEVQKPKSKLGLFIKRMVFLVLPVLVILGAIGGTIGMGMLQPKPEEKAETVEALPVLTAQATMEDVELTVRAQGEVRPRSEVMLAAQVGGRATYVSPSFLEGGQFKRGETLVQIDDEEFRLRVVQAEANVARAQTVLSQERSAADLAERESAELGVHNVSDLALRKPQLAEAQANLASALASLDEAKLHLSRTTLAAPFTGRVRERAVDVGAFITPGSKLGTIYASDIVDIPIPLTDSDLATLDLEIGFSATRDTPGPEVVLSATVAGERHTWSGQITRTDSGFDPETRVLFAYVQVDDPYGAGADNGTPLATGLFVTADIAGRKIAQGTTIPRTALRGNDRVFVVRADNTLEIRPVTVASSTRERAVLTSGLSAGETVVISPVRGAADGMKINPVDKLKVTSASYGASDAAATNTEKQE
jgi:RND family efflux transporter MFP subunit